MTLSKRRFTDTVRVVKETPGHRNEFGEFVPGQTSETVYPASIQPISLRDTESVGGGQLSQRLTVFVPVPNALIAARDNSPGDTVRIGADAYTVTESQSWSTWTRAILLREP